MATQTTGMLDTTTIEDAILTSTIQASKPKFMRPTDFNPSSTSVYDFLKTFEKCAVANNWNYIHKIRYFCIYLQGAAYTWYTRYEDNPQNRTKTWADIKEDFIKKFSWEDKNVATEKKLRTLKQGEDEPCKNYYYRLIDILDDREKDYADWEVQMNFEAGLSMQYHNAYYLVASRHMNTEELKDVIFRLDKHRCTIENEKKPINVPYTNFQQENFAQNCDAVNISDRTYPSPSNSHYSTWNTDFRSNSPRYFARRMKNYPLCYVCGKRGHLSYSCRRTISAIRRKRCHICNRIGHLARSCWNKTNISSKLNNHGPKNRNSSKFKNFQFPTVHRAEGKSPWNSANQYARAWSPPFQISSRNKPWYGRWKKDKSRRRSASPQTETYFRSNNRSPDRLVFPEEQRGKMCQRFQSNTAPVPLEGAHNYESP